MKLTPDQLAEIQSRADNGCFVSAPVNALLAHIAAMEADRDAWRGLWTMGKLSSDGPTVDEANAHLQWMNDRMLALTAENARLRDALRPFLEAWMACKEIEGSDIIQTYETGSGRATLRVSMLKAAHDALEGRS